MTKAGGRRAAMNRGWKVTGEGHPRGIWGMVLEHMSAMVAPSCAAIICCDVCECSAHAMDVKASDNV